MNKSNDPFKDNEIVHKKMYKSGKNWVIAASLLSASMLFFDTQNVQADTLTQQPDQVQTQHANDLNDQQLPNTGNDNGHTQAISGTTAQVNHTNSDVTNDANDQKAAADNTGQVADASQHPQPAGTQTETPTQHSETTNNDAQAQVSQQTVVPDDQGDPFEDIVDGSWQINGNQITYQRQDGTILKGLHTIRGNLQYFDPQTGDQIKGQFETVNNVTYYFDAHSGNSTSYARVANGIVTGADAKGQPLNNTYVDDPLTHKSYYFNASGQSTAYARTGIFDGKVTVSGQDSLGNSLKSGFADDSQGNRYYFDANGTFVTGFQTIGDNSYYFDPVGHLKKNYAISINGQWYFFNAQTGIGKSAIQYQVENGLTNQLDDFSQHNQAKNYTPQNFENVDGFITADTWYQPKDLYQNGQRWVDNRDGQLRPLLMSWWPTKQVQVDYLNFMQKQGLSSSSHLFSGTDSQSTLNSAAEQIQVAIESKIGTIRDTQWLRTLFADFIKTEPGWNSSSENIDYSGLQFQGGFLAYGNSSQTPNANSDYRELDRAPFNWDGQNSVLGSEFLLANDVDNSNPVVQAEQLNWLHYLMNFGSIVKNDPSANFDGIRIDAVDNVDADLLKIAGDYFKAMYGTDQNEANANQHLSILEDWSGADPAVVSNLGNPQLTIDDGLHSALINSLTKGQGSRSSLQDLINKTLVDRSNDFRENNVIPNFSFVRAHDSEVQAMLGQIITDTTNAVSGNNFTWDQLNQALKIYYADYASADKKYTHYNIPSAYAILLTDKNTVPRVYYGDVYTDGGQYMAQKSINYDAITTLLKARIQYSAGGQTMQLDNNGLLTSVRYGKGVADQNDHGTAESRQEGIGIIVGNNPDLRVRGNVVLHMGAAHKNQQYRALLLTTENGIASFQNDAQAPTAWTNNDGDLIFSDSLLHNQQYTNVRGYANALVSGYLAAWVPVGASASQDVRTESPHTKSTNNSVFNSNDALDSNVIYEGFSNFQSMPTQPSEFTNVLIAQNTDLFKSWGITSFELAPQYRSSADGTFLDSTIDNGYAFTDRYDLGFGAPTKYGTVDDLANALKALHAAGIQAIADWVPDQIYNLPGKEAATVTRVDQQGKEFSDADIKNMVYVVNTVGGGEYQKRYGGAFLDELSNDPRLHDLFNEAQISTGKAIDPSQKITEWSAKYFNGTNVLGRGADYVLKDQATGQYFKLGSTNEVFLPLQLIGKNAETGFYMDRDGNVSFYSTGGYKARNTFIQDGLGNWYYFDASGNMQRGTGNGVSALLSLNLNSDRNDNYFVLPNGTFEKNGFAEDVDGNNYFFDKNGKMLSNAYIQDPNGNGDFYYLDSQGRMARGLQRINGNLQFFLNNGAQLKNAFAYDNHDHVLYQFNDGNGNAVSTQGIRTNRPDTISDSYIEFDSSKQYQGSYAKIIYSVEPQSKTAFIVQENRHDGIFQNGPALSSDTTLQPDSGDNGAQLYSGQEVNVLQISITQRTNGSFYTYAKVQLRNGGRIFWIDTRALSSNQHQQTDYAVINGYDLHSYQGLINNRQDGVFLSGPALTNLDSMNYAYRTNDTNSQLKSNQAVTVLESISTRRSNGRVYVYAKVKLGNAIFWIDQRAITPLAEVQSTTSVSGQYAYIDGNSRRDGIYVDGPALTSLASQSPVAYSNDPRAHYNGKLVRVLEISTTRRSNGRTYQYAKIQTDANSSDVFWIDYRAISGQTHNLLVNYSTSNGSGSAIIHTGGRQDGIYKNGPALTTADAIFSDGNAADYNGHQVNILQVATTQRDNRQVYVYYFVQDGSDQYWVDRRSVQSIDQITQRDTNISEHYNEYALIDGRIRQDGIYQEGPALTSGDTKDAQGNSRNYQNALVRILEVDTTQRSANQSSYRYAHVQLVDPGHNNQLNDFWIDLRSLVYDKMVGSPVSNLGEREINQANRQDFIYSDLPYTTAASFQPAAPVGAFNGSRVTLLQRVAVTRFPSGSTYTYSLVQAHDQQQSLFWIDDRALRQVN